MAVIYGNSASSEDIDGTNYNDLIFGGTWASPFYDTGDDDIDADDGHDTVYGGDGDDMIGGGDGDDYLEGDEGNDTLGGGDDDDFLVGGYGDDTLNGGDDYDILAGGPGRDTLNGGNGNDFIVSDAADWPDFIDGGSGSEDFLEIDRNGVSDDLTLDLSDPADEQELGDGTTVVNIERASFYGGSGDDTFTGGSLEDLAIGRRGADSLTGSGGDDTLRGARGSDTVYGGDGDDLLDGGAGRDFLKGHDDDDVYIGGAGADVFIFGDNDGNDVIRDFESGEDVCDLSLVDDVDSFSDLDFDDLGASVRVDYGSGTFVLEDVSSVSALDSDDFIFA
jgi:Ca2+-binding RTX toxin-like protein